MFRSKLNANQHRKWWVPILEDRERLAVPISSGVQIIPTDTPYKDYEIGGYVGLRQLNTAGKITHWEELLITGRTDTEITTASQTVNVYTNPEVYPVRRAIISESQSLRGHTDSVEETTITARLVAEDEKSIPHRITAWTPNITYKSHDRFIVVVSRPSRRVRSGRGWSRHTRSRLVKAVLSRPVTSDLVESGLSKSGLVPSVSSLLVSTLPAQTRLVGSRLVTAVLSRHVNSLPIKS